MKIYSSTRTEKNYHNCGMLFNVGKGRTDSLGKMQMTEKFAIEMSVNRWFGVSWSIVDFLFWDNGRAPI